MRRPLLAVAAALGAVALTVSACSGGGGGANDAGLQPGDPITWMSTLHTPTTPEADGPIPTALEEHTGVEFEIEWVPAASSAEKLNAVLAANQLADLTGMSPLSNSTIRSALGSGMFWDVEPYLSEYDNLSQIDPVTIDGARVDGVLYGVPIQKPLARYGVLVRQDWLDNLGLEAPHTLDELAAVAQAFTEDDPDGNGKDDTVGVLDRAESFQLTFRTLAGYFGAGDQFELDESGQLVPSFGTDHFKQAMTWYRDLYQSGYVNSELITLQKANQQDAIAQGKGGIVITGLFEAKNYMALAQNADPETPMAWALINDMTFGDVDRAIISDTGGGVGGVLAISKENVPTEEGLKYVLGFIDSLLDEEAFDLMTNGIEGTHYEVGEGGVIETIDETAWEQQVQPYTSSRPSDVVTTYPSATPYVDEGNQLMEEQAPYAVVNPATGLSSQTYDSQWTTIWTDVQDAYFQYMTGDIEMADYEAVVEKAGSQGLDDIVTELNEAYAAANA